MESSDIAIIGGGILGLATAYRVTQRLSGRSLQLFEKESAVGQHQSGRNSGVLHSGIYYTPGSLKASNCRAGKRAMEAFCREQDIPFEKCGKVIVAVNEQEVPVLERIYQRGLANGVACERISPARLRELEPHAAGIDALHVPETGIVDFRQICQRLAALVQKAGGQVRTGTQVVGIRTDRDWFVLQTPRGSFRTRSLINCAGLHSDRVVTMCGEQPAVRIVPFRGEYYELQPSAHHLCRNLIYPVPDPNFPFLGVHFTRMIQGGVECGPNAVLAWAREGYRKTHINVRDTWNAIGYGGFLKLAGKYWRIGLGEMARSVSKRAFVRALQRLVPDIHRQDLVVGRSGVRAQAIAPDGTMVDDFLIQQSGPVIHVLNAPSPAATSALNIADLILDKLVGALA
ncbi:MAG: L-2-hydroxyglutarate oxidase [Pirellulaceae bacterium]